MNRVAVIIVSNGDAVDGWWTPEIWKVDPVTLEPIPNGQLWAPSGIDHMYGTVNGAREVVKEVVDNWIRHELNIMVGKEVF
jgi:hypothetical protein